MAFFDETICTGNDQSVRQALAPLAQLAEVSGCTILLVRHLNKNGQGKAVYRGGGSIGIVGACRSAWLIARHPDDEHQRVMAQVKNNLAPPQPSLAYEVVADGQGRPQVAWVGEAPLSADELLSPAAVAEEPSALAQAVALVREALAGGPRPAEEVVAALVQRGVSRRTLTRARREAGVVSTQDPTAPKRRAIWRLSAPETTPATPSPPTGGYQGSPEDGPYREGY
jgi:hypothetical protein